MTRHDTSPTVYRRIRLFGWSLYISPEPLHVKPAALAKEQNAIRREMTGYKCEGCGKEVKENSKMYRVLPRRSEYGCKVENIRVVCDDCYCRTQTDPAFAEKLGQKGGQA